MAKVRYTIVVRTGDKSGAGTDSDIDVVLNNSDSIRLNPYIRNKNAFERDGLDVAVLHLEDQGDIEKIKITSKCNYAAPGWFLQLVEVYKSGVSKSYFGAKRWVDKSNPVFSSIAEPAVIPRLLRPIYIIGHRCNDLDDIDLAIERGANALEIDIQYDDNNRKFYVNHDFANGKTIEQWLDKANEAANKFGDDFALIYFDIKEKTQNNLNKFIETVHNHCISQKNLYYVYSVATLDGAHQFKDCFSTLTVREGFCIDYENNAQEVCSFFKNNGIQRCWFGNGINAGGVITDNIRKSLQTAAYYRTQGDIQKTMIWTLEKKSTAEEFLKSGYKVDAIMTNCGGGDFPRDYIQNILEAFYDLNIDNGLRMATRQDNPFNKI